MKSILITGGAGFIGSHVVRLFVNKYPDYKIINLDVLTYAGNLENLRDIEKSSNYTFDPGTIQIVSAYDRDGYICQLYNTSAIAVTKRAAPVAGTIGSDQHICYNATPSTLTSSALPTGGVTDGWTYQWQSATDGIAGTYNDIASATSTSYTPGALTQTTYYRRKEINSCVSGSQYSNAITVTVDADVAVGVITAVQSICYNTAPAQLDGDGNNGSSLPTGGRAGEWTYQWQKSTDGTNYTNIGAATAENYTSGALTTSTYFRRKEMNTTCLPAGQYTLPILITVYPDLTAGTIGSNQSICYNTTPTALSGTAATGGNGGFTYDWQSSTDGTNWSSTGGTTEGSYAPGALTTSTYYRRVATNVTCATIAVSDTVTITVAPNVTVPTIGSAHTICYNGDPDALTGTAPTGGMGGWTYKWQHSTDDATWSDFDPSITTRNFDPPSGLQVSTYYRRLEYNTCLGGGVRATNSVLVTVHPILTTGTIGADQTICYNTTPAALTSLTLPTGGSATWTYQWQNSTDGASWSNIAGATTTAYTPLSALTQTTYYRRVEYETTCMIEGQVSNTVTVTVRPIIVDGTIGTNQSICYNTTPTALTSLTLPTGGSATWTYQWQVSTDGGTTYNNIGGATLTTYAPGALTATTMYRRMEIDGICALTGTHWSNAVTITVYNDITYGDISADQSICYGATPAQLDGTASTGGKPGDWTYQWQQSTDGGTNWSDIAGSTLANYQPGALTVTTKYRRADINTCSPLGTHFSSVVTITVYNDEVAGALTPTTQTVCFNGTATITGTAATGGKPADWTYQWEKKEYGGAWATVAGATDASYSPSSITITTQYRRNDINTCATVNTLYTNTATVSVNPQIVVGTISSDQTICYGATPSAFTSTAPNGGSGAWTYQWQKATDAIDGTYSNITDATSETYAPGALTTTTYYRREEFNSCVSGHQYSNAITVTVYPNVSYGVIATNESVCYNGNPVAFTSTNNASGGDGSWGYMWEKSTDGTTWAVATPLTTTNVFDPPALTVTTYYRRVAYNSCGEGASNTLTITVYPLCVKGSIAASQTVCYNTAPAAFTSSTTPTGGNGAWTYQWQKNINSAGWNDIAGATNAGYTESANITVPTQYRRKEINSCAANQYTDPVTITVSSAIIAGEIAGTQAVCHGGDPATLTSNSAPIGGNGSWTYQWQSDPGQTDTWGNISDATSETYDPPSGITQTTDFRRMEINTCAPSGTQWSNEITVTVYNSLTQGSISATSPICSSAIPTINNVTVPTGGNGAWSYLWEVNSNGGGWSTVGGATSSSYTPASGITVSTQYRRKEFNSCVSGTQYSNTVTVDVFSALVAGSIGSDQSICSGGDPAEFTETVAASGGSSTFTYQWQYLDGVTWTNIGGANSTNYNVPAGLVATTQYRRVTTDAGCLNSAASNTVTVTIFGAATAGTISSAQTICYNTAPATLTGTAASGSSGTFTYSWEYSTDNINWNATGYTSESNYTPSALTASTYYRRISTSSCGSSPSNTILITVNPLSVGGTTAGATSVCSGSNSGNVTLSGNTGSIVKWQYSTGDFSSWNDIANTSATYTYLNLTTNTQYRAVVQNSPCSVAASSATEITVVAPSVGGTTAGAASVCATSNTGNIILSGHTGSITKWQYTTGDFSSWSDIANTSATMTYTNLAITTRYRAIIQNSPCSIVASSTTDITVSPATVAGTTAGAITVCANSNSGNVTLSGNTGSIVKWQYSTGDFSTWNDIANVTATNSYLNLTTTTRYRAIVQSSPCDAAASTTTQITVTEAASLTSHPSNATACVGNNTTFAVVTSGPITSYQWQVSTNSGDTWNNITAAGSNPAYSGYTSGTITLTGVVYANSGYFYRCVIDPECGVNINSSYATLSVTETTVGGTASGSATVCSGDNEGSISLIGNVGSVINWESTTDNWTNTTTISSTNTSISYLNLTATTKYRAVVQNCLIARSSDATITVNAPSVGGTTAGAASVCASSNSGNITLSGNTGSVTKWQYCVSPFVTWNDIANVTTTQAYSNLSQTTRYRAIVQNSPCSIAASTTSEITVTSVAASVSIVASSNPFCSGTQVTFTATPTNGGTPTYQWYVNGSTAGTNSNEYTYSPANNDHVYVAMTSSIECATPSIATSSTITMELQADVTPSVTIAASNNPICTGNNVTFTATPTNGGSSPAYQWYLNGNTVGTNNYQYSNAELANSDHVWVVLTSSVSCASQPSATSTQITMTVETTSSPAVSISASSSSITEGDYVLFTATPTNGGTTPAYQWYLNGSTVGTNSNQYSSTTLANNDSVWVVMTSSLSCSSPTTATSNKVKMSVTPLIPEKLVITTNITPQTANVAFNIVVQAQTNSGVLANVSEATSITINSNKGAGTVSGSGTMALGTSSATISVTYLEANGASGVTLTASATGLTTSAATNAFDVRASEPTTQATSIAFTPTTGQLYLSWTAGSGSKSVVFAIKSSDSTNLARPVDGSTYTANSVYQTAGTEVGSSYCVYNGSGTNVTVTNVTYPNYYYFRVSTYNGDGATSNYNQGGYVANANPRKARPSPKQGEYGDGSLNSMGGNLAVSAPMPNPASDKVRFAFELIDNADNVTIQIINMAGQTILTPVNNANFEVGRHELDINFPLIASGNYIIIISSGNEVMTVPLTIAK